MGLGSSSDQHRLRLVGSLMNRHAKPLLPISHTLTVASKEFYWHCLDEIWTESTTTVSVSATDTE